MEAAVKAKNKEEAQKALNVAFSQWDKASKTNVIHKNSANNQKARLAKLVASI